LFPRNIVRDPARSKMHFANCATLAAVLFTML